MRLEVSIEISTVIVVDAPAAAFTMPCWRLQVPGVSNIDFLRAASNARRKAIGQAELVRRFLCFLHPHLHTAATHADAHSKARQPSPGPCRLPADT